MYNVYGDYWKYTDKSKLLRSSHRYFYYLGKKDYLGMYLKDYVGMYAAFKYANAGYNYSILKLHKARHGGSSQHFEGGGRQITWEQDFETGLAIMAKSHLY